MILDWLRLFVQNFRAVRAERRAAAHNEATKRHIVELRASIQERQRSLDDKCQEVTELRNKALQLELEQIAAKYAYRHSLQVKDVQVELDFGGHLFVVVTDSNGRIRREPHGILQSAQPN